MLQDTKSHTVASFLASDFCRVSPALAEEICKATKLSPTTKPHDVKPQAAGETLYKNHPNDQIMAPPTNLHFPDRRKGDPSFGLYKQIKGEFYGGQSATGRVSRYPFVIEAGLAFGKGPEDLQAAANPQPGGRGRPGE